MPIIGVKQYFENVGTSLGLKQATDPFGAAEVASTKLDQAFHVFLDSVSGITRQNEAYDLESVVTFIIYQKGFKDVNAGMNKLINRAEDVLLASINNAASNGIIGVTMDQINFEAISETRNDNVLLARIGFRVKHILCLD